MGTSVLDKIMLLNWRLEQNSPRIIRLWSKGTPRCCIKNSFAIMNAMSSTNASHPSSTNCFCDSHNAYTNLYVNDALGISTNFIGG
jgi:hypothetical protein